MLESGSCLSVVAALVVSVSLCWSAMSDPVPAFVAEQFGTGARCRGASIGYRSAGLLGGGFTPVMVATLAVLCLASATIAG